MTNDHFINSTTCLLQQGPVLCPAMFVCYVSVYLVCNITVAMSVLYLVATNQVIHVCVHTVQGDTFH